MEIENVKYKVWGKEKKKICEVHSIHFGTRKVMVASEYGGDITLSFDDVVLMQYSGMDGIDGQEIYNGTIVKIPEDWDTYGHNAGEVYEVCFAYGGFRLKPKYGRGARGFYLEDNGVYEVLGTVFENPELLDN